MNKTKRPKPNYWWAILTMKCPRCRRGQMFTDSRTYRNLKLSHILGMPDSCQLCHQKFDLEPGFWYGTGYISYALAFAVSVATFIAWVLLIGISINDNRIFGWLIFNAVFLVVLQPWLMRLSRVFYIRFFVKYDDDYEATNPQEFDY